MYFERSLHVTLELFVYISRGTKPLKSFLWRVGGWFALCHDLGRYAVWSYYCNLHWIMDLEMTEVLW